MHIPNPGIYVRVYYHKELPGGIIGEEGEIVSITKDHVNLKFQPKYEDAQPVKSSIPRNEIKRVIKVNA